ERTVSKLPKKAKPPVSKRQRSDDSAKASESKRVCPGGILASLSTKPELQVAIIDRSNPDGKLSVDNWLILEGLIDQGIADAITRPLNPFVAEFDGINWYKGVKVVACANEESLRFLKDTLLKLEAPWPGAKIDVVPVDQIPERTIIKVWIPPSIREDRTTLILIKSQNADCHTAD
ncbi:hypothetical protein KR044_007730, partial [Drosophila immigrans]